MTRYLSGARGGAAPTVTCVEKSTRYLSEARHGAAARVVGVEGE
jgi:hypothetical protein